MITRYHGQPLNIQVTYPSDPLAAYGSDMTARTAVRMNLKRNLAKDQDDQYLQKTEVAGGVVILAGASDFTFIMQIDEEDYAQIDPDIYHLTVNVQIPAYDTFIELGMTDRRVHIIPDTNRS